MVIVESHHYVLEAWAEYRARLPFAPRLLTLDHHTDTSSPFRKYFSGTKNVNSLQIANTWLASIDYKDPATIKAVLPRLSHDEHIVTAIKTNIIAAAFVIAQNAYDTDLAIYKEHKIMCLGLDRKENSKGLTPSDCDRALESEFLDEMLLQFDTNLSTVGEAPLLSTPYILDIDLDYLNTLRAAQPQNSAALRRLAKHAGLITVATEPNHVQMCAFDKNLTSEGLLEQITKLLSTRTI